MNWYTIFAAVLAALATGQVSFKIADKYEVSVNLVTGAPVHLTFAAALLAVEKIVAGQTGTFQSGDINVTIAPITS
jgi:hypothetical protein